MENASRHDTALRRRRVVPCHQPRRAPAGLSAMQTLPIKQILKTLLSIFAVFALVWMAVIAWWKHGNRVPSTRDITDYLVLMPSVIVIAYTLLGRMIGSIKHTLQTPGAAPQGGSIDTAPQPETSGNKVTPRPAPSAAFRHAIMRSPLGTKAGLIKAQLKQGKTAPLDPTLLNQAGYPRRVARISDLPSTALADTRLRLEAGGASLGGLPPSLADGTLRAVTLLLDVCRDAFLQLHQACADSLAATSHSDTVRPVRSFAFELIAIAPADWSSALTQQTIRALQQMHEEVAAQHGVASTVAMQIHASTATSSDDAYRVVAHAIDRLHRTPPPVHDAASHGIGHTMPPAVVIIAATHSSIYDAPGSETATAGEAAVAIVLGAMPEVHAASAGPDRLPGEMPSREPGASRPSGTAHPYLDEPDVIISAPGFAEHDVLPTRDAETEGNDNHDGNRPPPSWEALTHETLRASATSAETMGALFSDVGATGPESIKMSQFWAQAVAHLAARRDCFAIRGACGETGAAGALLSVALAAADTAEHGHPALAMTLSERQALAMLVTRAGVPPTDRRIASPPDTSEQSASSGTPTHPNIPADSQTHVQPLAA